LKFESKIAFSRLEIFIKPPKPSFHSLPFAANCRWLIFAALKKSHQNCCSSSKWYKERWRKNKSRQQHL